MKPKVTIVIPVYNGANYMREAIDSALAQTYKNIEVIVVNDGSTDDGATKQIAESYGEKIKYLEKENGGVSTALNLALKNMTGEYFSWLSHDDKYYPTKIEKEVEEILKHDKNTIILSDFDLIDENSKVFNTVKHNHKMIEAKPDYALLRGCANGITLLIPKSAFDEFGFFDEKLRCVQDYLMWYKMMSKYNFVHVPEVLAMSRVHSNQVTVTSPKVISEGNWLWTYMTKEYPKEKMVEYEGSEYLFYEEMANFLKNSTIYEESAKDVKKLADEILKEERKNIKKKEVTVIVIDNENEEELKESMASLENQTFKNVKILIQGETKYKKYPNSNNIKDSLKQISTDYYTFINAGVIAKENWLEESIQKIYISRKAMLIPNYDNKNTKSLKDNLSTLLVPLDGIVFDNKYKAKYTTQSDYLLEIAHQGGVVANSENYLTNVREHYEMSDVFNILSNVLNDENSTDYEKAALCYEVVLKFNKYAPSMDKVSVYEPCDELKEMMFSRSFRMLKKYMDKKKSKNK